MPTIPTEHELRQEAEERDRMWTKRVREVRADLARTCPAGRWLDHAHLVTMLGQQPSSTKPWLALAYLAVHGAGTVGVSNAELVSAVGVSAETLARFKARDVWWDPPTSALADLPEAYRGRVVGPR